MYGHLQQGLDSRHEAADLREVSGRHHLSVPCKTRCIVDRCRFCKERGREGGGERERDRERGEKREGGREGGGGRGRDRERREGREGKEGGVREAEV